ncbi:hypothetical protein B0H34DRAFT_667733 [Crassisporium funariophilum]|nr:hypothetical protein B0H34DRAFT_667733 [Crassisporium funariophilum]
MPSIFRAPLTTAPSSPLKAPRSPFAIAPGDLLIEIALFLETRSDILNLCLTSNYVFANVSSVLYETVVLQSIEQCSLTLGMLHRRSDIARHVRQLVIRPQVKFRSLFSSMDGAAASAAVRKLAGAMCLDALVRFTWDAEELPYYEDMWFALRVGCPQLRYVATSIGAILPDLNSHLFDFQDLHGFALILKSGFYETHVDMFLDEDQPIFKRFWDMLTRRCPHLQELTLDGLSSVPTDIHFLVQGRWPDLRHLTLGDVCIDWFPRAPDPSAKRPFIAFLEAHPQLESLSLTRHTIQPLYFSALAPPALGSMTRFSGTHQQLAALLPLVRGSLKEVRLRDAVETREVSATAVAGLLRELTGLVRLKIAFTLHSMYDSGNLLRSLIQSCPMLRHLELTCGHKPSFQLDTFAKTIRGFPKLRTLSLTIVKYPGDAPLSLSASLIASSNPRLHTFTLTFIPPVYPVPLPFALPLHPLSLFLPFPQRATGRYEVGCDEHGLPVRMVGVERCEFEWPWGWGVMGRERRYVKELGPGRGRRRKGWRGLWALVMERSVAGEEMRMFLFCAFLAFLAGCGISANGVKKGMRVGEVVYQD